MHWLSQKATTDSGTEFGPTFGYFWRMQQQINGCNVMFDLSIDYVAICKIIVIVVFEFWAWENGSPPSSLPTPCWPIEAADGVGSGTPRVAVAAVSDDLCHRSAHNESFVATGKPAEHRDTTTRPRRRDASASSDANDGNVHMMRQCQHGQTVVY